MKSIKGTKTEQNLLTAFAGESQARNRYTYFASVAKKEGYEQIAGIFLETADQEKEHAKKFFKYLEGGCLSITASFPAGVIGTTEENLKAAAMGENRYLKLLSRLTDGNFFIRDHEIWWQCRNCGYICKGTEAPKICPACKHPQAYFEPKRENY